MTAQDPLAGADLERFIRFDRDIVHLAPRLHALATEMPRLLDDLARAIAIRSPGCRLRWVRRDQELAWDFVVGMPNHVCRSGIRITPGRDSVLVWPVFEGPPATGLAVVERVLRGVELDTELRSAVIAVAVGAITVCQPIARSVTPDARATDPTPAVPETRA